MYEISYFFFCIFVRRVIELFSEPPWKSGNENPYTRIRRCWENNNTLQVNIHIFYFVNEHFVETAFSSYK